MVQRWAPHWRTITVSPTLVALVKNGTWLPVGGASGAELLGKSGERVLLAGDASSLRRARA